jgi:hypothetical protein
MTDEPWRPGPGGDDEPTRAWSEPPAGPVSPAEGSGDPWGSADEPASRPGGGRSWDQLIAGGLLVLVGVLWLLDAAAGVDVPWRSLLPMALVVVGLATVAVALVRPAGELVTIGVVLTVLVVASAVAPPQLSVRIGDRTERPVSVEQADEPFAHGIGELTVDLRELDLVADTTVEASLGVGEITVVVPSGVPLEVRGTAAVGDVAVLDQRSSGLGPRVDERFPAEDGGPTLRVEVSVGVGQVRVERR